MKRSVRWLLGWCVAGIVYLCIFAFDEANDDFHIPLGVHNLVRSIIITAIVGLCLFVAIEKMEDRREARLKALVAHFDRRHDEVIAHFDRRFNEVTAEHTKAMQSLNDLTSIERAYVDGLAREPLNGKPLRAIPLPRP